MRRAHALLAALLLTGGLAGCQGDDEAPGSPDAGASETSPPEARASDRAHRPDPSLRTPSCPAGLEGCRTASGRIVYVERVDPDGDGDAHFVLASRQSITAPGLSVIDVKRSLRPHPLPGVGDRLGAAGPVHTGSYGQRQIEAVQVRVARSR